MTSTISRLHARQILDSRGNPTVEVEATLASGAFGRAAIPSGASTGRYEAVELRDGDPAVYGGKGVLHAVRSVETEIAAALAGMDAGAQADVDRVLVELDGTPNKGRLGANAILGASLAVAKAGAADAGVSLFRWIGGDGAHVLPVPMLNVLNGGMHAQNSVDFQEFMVVPAGAASFAEALRIGAETFHTLKRVLHDRGLATGVGDEGGFAPDLPSTEAVIDAILEAAQQAGHGDKVALALDPASSSFFRDGSYRLDGEGRALDARGMIDLYASLAERYPLVSIEDGLGEDDWDDWRALTERLGERVQLVGDDLFVTNVERLGRGIETGAANARRRTRRSPTWPSRQVSGRSRPARPRGRTGSRSTTSSCASRRSLAGPRSIRGGTLSPPSGPAASVHRSSLIRPRSGADRTQIPR